MSDEWKVGDTGYIERRDYRGRSNHHSPPKKAVVTRVGRKFFYVDTERLVGKGLTGDEEAFHLCDNFGQGDFNYSQFWRTLEDIEAHKAQMTRRSDINSWQDQGNRRTPDDVINKVHALLVELGEING